MGKIRVEVGEVGEVGEMGTGEGESGYIGYAAEGPKGMDSWSVGDWVFRGRLVLRVAKVVVYLKVFLSSDLKK
jgi:hypothetical protein